MEKRFKITAQREVRFKRVVEGPPVRGDAINGTACYLATLWFTMWALYYSTFIFAVINGFVAGMFALLTVCYYHDAAINYMKRRVYWVRA